MADEAVAMTDQDLHAELSRQCDLAGGQSAWAKAKQIIPSQVSEALSGKRGFTDGIINAMGYMRVIRYIPMRGKKNG